MSFFSKVFKSSSSQASIKTTKSSHETATPRAVPKPKWEDAWTRKEVAPEEVAELLHVCSIEMKSRALDTPFLLLPFRPNADPSAARNFIRNFFKNGPGEPVFFQGESLRHEMRLVEPMVLCSIMKWTWSRLRGGVVGWNTYELFKTGEIESQMAKHAFDSFIPLSVDSTARKDIIFDFFDLLSAIAANGKTNGLGGRKLSRLAGWWAFDHSDSGSGFDGGYKSWENAAGATCHLFFAYLRARMPDSVAGSNGISQLPRSLLALVSQTEYPPETPTLLLASTPKIVMVVERVSSTPYALLRRARHFGYPDNDDALQKFSDYEDPISALTFECRRVLDCVSTTNQSVAVNHETSLTSPPDNTWSRFEDLGFSSLLDNRAANGEDSRGYNSADNTRAPNGVDLGRPTTPSWADFLSSGFADDASSRGPSSLLLPPEQILPPLNPQRVQSSQSHVRPGIHDDNLEPGELSYVNRIDLDETFWWVWMTSLAGEETPSRKAVFGRCAFVETEIKGAKWLVMEEQVRGAAVAPDATATVIQKRGKFGLSIRGRPRRSSLGKRPPMPKTGSSLTASASTPALPRTKPGADQKAKIQAAAAELVRQQTREREGPSPPVKRGRLDLDVDSKTNSVMTLGLGSSLQSEAGPAMQWARKFDKDTIRSRYLGDSLAGSGISRSASPATTVDLISATRAVPEPKDEKVSPPSVVPSAPAVAPVAVRPADPIIPKASAKAAVASEETPQSQQKPVSELPAHPASTTVVPAPRLLQSAVPAQSPAAAAAAAAAAMRTTAPNQNGAAQKPASENVAKSKTGSTRKFKSLFNRKKGDENEEPEALVKHREMSLRKKRDAPIRETVAVPETVNAPAEPARTVAAPAPTTEQIEAGEPGPTVETNNDKHESALPTNPHERNKSSGNFSDFTQGPLEDQPALVAEEEATETEHDQGAAALEAAPPAAHEMPAEVPADAEAKTAPVAAPKAAPEEPATAGDEVSSVASSTTAVGAAPVADQSDRWAQVRQNALERKAEQQAAEERQPQHAAQTSASGRTEKTDDGETSGEETIEQRVARIRARVAQLTGSATGDPLSQAQ